jgi:hypothetical protein
MIPDRTLEARNSLTGTHGAGQSQQQIESDLLAEQPPAQHDGDERADERIGAGELAGCIAQEQLLTCGVPVAGSACSAAACQRGGRGTLRLRA